MPVLIHPIADFLIGGALGLCFYFTVTNSWWSAPILFRRLFP